MTENKSSTTVICERARRAKVEVASLSAKKRNEVLFEMANEIEMASKEILAANRDDLARAYGKISDVMLDRLRLDEGRVCAMAESVRAIARLSSPLGEVIEERTRPNGLVIRKVCVPIGVIAIIYESRPNVTSDAAALAFQSGNVCILRSGKEAYGSALAITNAMRRALASLGVTEDAIQLISDTSRDSANELMRAEGYVDLLIPRGGRGLIETCTKNSTVPCLETGTGICHIYIDRSADISMALDIVENAKTSRPSVCNACEVLLVHREIAKDFLPLLRARLVDERQNQGLSPVLLRLDGESGKIIEGERARACDFDTEFLDYILAVAVVGSTEEAILHIETHSTNHSEAIVTEDDEEARKFCSGVDSAAVYVNASTRFTDGGEFGLGCEMGISTQRLHARGPLGVRELTTYKYIVLGQGQIR